jgi:transcriptional regulator with XRE-family HTH domain
MSEHSPEPPPYGALIEDAREKAGLSAREAARRTGISDAWWRYLVRGYQKAPGDLNARAETIARMARVVGVTPDRLETEGERPDAAEILREILRTPPEPPAAERRLEAVPGPLTLPDDPADEEVEDFILDQESAPLRRILMRTWRTESIPRGVRVASVRAVAEAEAQASRPAEARERRREPGA